MLKEKSGNLRITNHFQPWSLKQWLIPLWVNSPCSGFSGVIKSDSQVFNSSKGKNKRIGQLFIIKRKNQEPTTELGAGDIGGVAKLQETYTGDTLSEKDKPIVLSGNRIPQTQTFVGRGTESQRRRRKISAGLSRLMEERSDISQVTKDTVTVKSWPPAWAISISRLLPANSIKIRG